MHSDILILKNRWGRWSRPKFSLITQTLTHNCCFSVASERWNYQQPCMLCTGSSRGPTNTTCTTGIPVVMLHQWFGGLLLSYLLGGSYSIPGVYFFCTVYRRGRRIGFSSLTTCVCSSSCISLWPTSKLPSVPVTNAQPACGQQRKAGHKWPSCESGELNECAVKCCWQKRASWIKFPRMYEGWKNNCRLFDDMNVVIENVDVLVSLFVGAAKWPMGSRWPWNFYFSWCR